MQQAAEENGKPGAFTRVGRARDVFDADQMESDWVWIHEIEITNHMVAAGGCYVKIADADSDRAPIATVMAIGKRRP